jgi:hypothetical protein
MCDYSLMGVPNRVASEGEDLIVCKFRTGSRGLTPETSATNTETRSEGFRSVVKKLFGPLEPEKVAVCIPPGARLLLGDISEDVQKCFGVGATEEVTFTQLTATPYRYRDAVRFKSGREILLQQLNQGQRVRVLALSLVEEPVRSIWESAEFFRY